MEADRQLDQKTDRRASKQTGRQKEDELLPLTSTSMSDGGF
jgi:hypothetical protein